MKRYLPYLLVLGLSSACSCDGSSPADDAGMPPDSSTHDASALDGSDPDGSDPDANTGCSTATECDDLDPCTEDVCEGSGQCAHPAGNEGGECDDGDACTQADTCEAGACVGDDPVVCTALDACHAVGTCDPGTGVCSDPAGNEGGDCDDGDACTQVDTCEAGACVGDDPVVCTALDVCHDVGTCDPGTGVCSEPAGNEGGDCDDSDACTQVDTCASGACVGGDPIVCTALDVCHDVGTCDPGTGVCSDPTGNEGGTCAALVGPGLCMTGVCDPLPVVLARQDFEVAPASPTWTFTGTPNFLAGFSSASAAPANSPLGIGGSRAWETNTVPGGLLVEFTNVTIPAGFDRVRLRFRLAGMSLASSSGGPDNLDYVVVGLNVDNGGFYDRVRIRGSVNDNSVWGYDATGVAVVDSTPAIETMFQRMNSGYLADGYSTVEVVFPGTASTIAVRIIARSSSSSDSWLIDDVELIGEFD